VQGMQGMNTMRPPHPQHPQHVEDQHDAALPAFAGGLLRLTTPNSALLGSVLDSPTKAGPGQWMDPDPLHGTALEGGQQGAQQQGQQQERQQGQAMGQDDVAALMSLW
jgi:hypothetical protein